MPYTTPQSRNTTLGQISRATLTVTMANNPLARVLPLAFLFPTRQDPRFPQVVCAEPGLVGLFLTDVIFCQGQRGLALQLLV